jgi:diacylglycerol kinase
MRASHLVDSFRFAFEGISHALKTQRNFRIHIAIFLFIVMLGLLFKLSLIEWAIIAIVSGLVFQAELMNTALEAIVDHVAPEFHALAKVAKDCAAGAVVISALAAVIVGLLIFWPKFAIWIIR